MYLRRVLQRLASPRRVEDLHILALFGLAVAQPFYDFQARNLEFLIVRRAEPLDIVAMTVTLSLLLPGALAVIVELAGLLGESSRRVALTVTFLLLSFVLALGALRTFPDLGSTTTLTAAALAAALLTYGYLRYASIQTWFNWLTPAIVVLPAYFLLFSGASRLVIDRTHQVVPVSADSKTPVIFIVFDEMSSTALMDKNRQIDAGRFPNFARLASRSTWYRNASTVADMTRNSIPAVVTGNLPDPDREPTVSDYPHNLFTLLGGAYQVHAMEAITRLCPRSTNDEETTEKKRFWERMETLLEDGSIVLLHLVLPPELTAGLPQLRQSQTWAALQGSTEAEFSETGSRTRRRDLLFRRFVVQMEGSPADERPKLYFLHVILPHIPYSYLPDGQEYVHLQVPMLYGQKRLDVWDEDPDSSVPSLRRYLLQVAFVDRLLGELLDRLKVTRLYDRSLIILTSDHGVSFQPLDERRHVTRSNAGSILPVPLFVKRPYQDTSVIDDRNAQSIDILPTIAQQLHINLPWPVQGVSLDGPAPARPRKTLVSSTGRRLEFPATQVAKEEAQVLKRQTSLFGSGSLGGLYLGGPRPELLGRAVDSFEFGAPYAGTVRGLVPGPTFEARTRGHFLPTLVTGHVRFRPAPPEDLDLAIALNGSIRATTRSLRPIQGQGHFEAQLPPECLLDGRNDLQVFVVRGAEASPWLQEVPLSSSQDD